ncbi:hypothetical protein KSP40_PGU020105 [Platanthera guangdongensis]|uniref:GH10 domain-containing protein n=1 Tax=Platanthera guangdongensis TaxID=2320717 RepID=A0ABR2LKH0_9ASPA
MLEMGMWKMSELGSPACIIRNPEFSRGIPGWSIFRNSSIGERTSGTGNKYLVSYSGSASKQFLLEKEKLYAFSVWLQTSDGNADIIASFQVGGEVIHAGAIEAKSGCWSMLKGGLSVDVTGPAVLFFEHCVRDLGGQHLLAAIYSRRMEASSNPDHPKGKFCFQEKAERKLAERMLCRFQILITLQFLSLSTSRIFLLLYLLFSVAHYGVARTRLVRVKAMDANGALLRNAAISIKQQRPGFPFGTAIPKSILTNTLYQNWFTSRFTVTTFENEMKWYSTETSQGNENYYTADAMLAFAEQHRIAVRGHNIFWDDPKYQMGWVTSLPYSQLKNAAGKRLYSIVSRYKGRLIAWDVNNENLHFSFFEQRLGSGFSGDAFWRAGKLDPGTMLFLNDYNTLEQPGDTKATPDKYLAKLKEMQDYTKYSGKIAIGVESHFNQPNIPFMRAALDKLAGAGVPIWLTEVDVFRSPNQAQYLEAILREGFSHPAVQGIVMWAGWHAEGCDRMCLTDNNFKNLPSGDVVDKLISEWRSETVVGRTDNNGIFEARLFHGEHEITVLQSSAGHLSVNQEGAVLSSEGMMQDCKKMMIELFGQGSVELPVSATRPRSTADSANSKADCAIRRSPLPNRATAVCD